jgi:uncharacterized Fe-S cluster-containing radical SAM superfamily protein
MHYKYYRADDFKDIPRPDFHAYSGKLILYGAGVNGLIAAVLLKKMGVEFICFVDSDEKKWDTEYMGKPVISPRELKEHYPPPPHECAIMVTPYQFRPVYRQLCEMGYKNLFDCLHLFLEFDTEDIEPLLPKHYSLDQFPIVINNYLRKLHTFHVSERSGLKTLSLFITEKCTLRCKKCMSYMPYYTNPKDCEFEKMSVALDRLLSFGQFSHICIEGGEIFLYKRFAELMEKLISFTNVDLFYPITNATLLPNERILKSFRHEKVKVRISNYGENSYKYNELLELFERENIAYFSFSQIWYDVAIPTLFNRSEDDNQKIYENCCKSDGNPFLVHGKLYRCSFAAHLENLGILSHSPEDSVDLLVEPYNKDELHNKVDEFYMRDKFIQACRYCNKGRGYVGKKIPIAEQAVGELPPLPNFCKQERCI